MPEPEPALSRADLNLVERALRQDWPIPPRVKASLLNQVVDIIDPAEGAKETPPRTKLAAMKVLAQFMKLNVYQQQVDLARDQLAARNGDDQVGHAEVLDPALASRVLKSLTHDPIPVPEPDPEGDPEHPSDDS